MSLILKFHLVFNHFFLSFEMMPFCRCVKICNYIEFENFPSFHSHMRIHTLTIRGECNEFTFCIFSISHLCIFICRHSGVVIFVVVIVVVAHAAVAAVVKTLVLLFDFSLYFSRIRKLSPSLRLCLIHKHMHTRTHFLYLAASLFSFAP